MLHRHKNLVFVLHARLMYTSTNKNIRKLIDKQKIKVFTRFDNPVRLKTLPPVKLNETFVYIALSVKPDIVYTEKR